MATLDERLDLAERMMKKPAFRHNKGLGNEVGYYIFDYPSAQEWVAPLKEKYMF